MAESVSDELVREAKESHAHHPPDGIYVRVFLFLVVITAIEVSIVYIHALRRAGAEVPLLLFFMAVKFFTVTYYFMHLRFDPPLCRRVFNFGLTIAVCVYITMLAMFHFWASGFR
jgi:cytochrome c oxidase subunit 4